MTPPALHMHMQGQQEASIKGAERDSRGPTDRRGIYSVMVWTIAGNLPGSTEHKSWYGL